MGPADRLVIDWRADAVQSGFNLLVPRGRCEVQVAEDRMCFLAFVLFMKASSQDCSALYTEP